jgi:hypothetical protein
MVRSSRRILPQPVHVIGLRLAKRKPYDWSDEVVSVADVRLIVSVCALHDSPAVRDAGRRLAAQIPAQP